MTTFFANTHQITALNAGHRFTMKADDPRFEDTLSRLKNGDLHELDALETAFLPRPAASLMQLDDVHILIEDNHLALTDDRGDTHLIGGALLRRLTEAGIASNVGRSLLAFLRRCRHNPRPEAILELYDFLESSGMPITTDGHFLAYKKIRSDFKDIYTGTIDNSPGSRVTMPRDKVNNDRTVTCATGLHFAAHDYLSHYGAGPGNVVVLVKIDPADVVAIPEDYANQKGRCSAYTVMAAISMTDRFEAAFTPDYGPDDTEDDRDDDWDEGNDGEDDEPMFLDDTEEPLW